MQELMLVRRGSSVNLMFEKDERQFEILLERTSPSEIVWSQKPYAAPKEYSLRMIGSSDVHKVEMTDDGIFIFSWYHTLNYCIAWSCDERREIFDDEKLF